MALLVLAAQLSAANASRVTPRDIPVVSSCSVRELDADILAAFAVLDAMPMTCDVDGVCS